MDVSLTVIYYDLRTGDAKIDQVVDALANSGLVLPGGIATSLVETGQQWFVTFPEVLSVVDERKD